MHLNLRFFISIADHPSLGGFLDLADSSAQDNSNTKSKKPESGAFPTTYMTLLMQL